MSKLMKDIIEVTLIAKDEVKQAKIPKALLEELIERLQKEEEVAVHFVNETLLVSGLVVGSFRGLILGSARFNG